MLSPPGLTPGPSTGGLIGRGVVTPLLNMLQAPSLHGATALDPIDKISSRGAGAQCAAQYNLIEPGRAPAQGPLAQSAASIGLGLQLYFEDIDHAMAP